MPKKTADIVIPGYLKWLERQRYISEYTRNRQDGKSELTAHIHALAGLYDPQTWGHMSVKIGGKSGK